MADIWRARWRGGRPAEITSYSARSWRWAGTFTDHRTDKYRPYAVDWRFLPEHVLTVKDTLRHHLVTVSNTLAVMHPFSKFWAFTLGLGPLAAVKLANFLFVHIPKTGGTSVSRHLYSRNLPHYTAQFWADVYGAEILNIPSFSVVRHPAERIASAYRMIQAGGTDIMAYSYYWKSRLSGATSIDSLLDYICEHHSTAARIPADLRSQSEYILDREGRVCVDRLFALQKGRGFPEGLAPWIGARSLPHLNATPNSALELGGQVMRRIQRLYEPDFEIYDTLMRRGGDADMRGERFR